MEKLFENWRRYLTEAEEPRAPIKISLKMEPEWEGNWEDTDVAVAATKDGNPDANITGGKVTADARNFALLIDKLAEYLGVREPVVTSAYRNSEAQLRAILGIWSRPIPGLEGLSGKEDALRGLKGEKNAGSKYIMNMYRECEEKKACLEGSAELAIKLVDIWEEGQEASGQNAVNAEAYQESLRQIENNGGMSMHQSGKAIDYGLKSNADEPDGVRTKMLIDYIDGKLDSPKLADMHPIDETVGPGPHWHLTVFNLTPAGVNFLETPNNEWKP